MKKLALLTSAMEAMTGVSAGISYGRRKHTPRVLTPEQRAKHDEKMWRRHVRWAAGIAHNPCLSLAQKVAILN